MSENGKSRHMSAGNHQDIRKSQNTRARFMWQKLALLLCAGLLLSLPGNFFAGHVFAADDGGEEVHTADNKGHRPGPVAEAPTNDGRMHKF